MHCYCCCCRWVMISPQKKKKIVCAMKIKKLFTETPGNRLIHSGKKKNFGRPPRERQCSDRAQSSTTGSGRPSCIDVVLRFWLKVLVRRDKFENRRKNHNYTYTYVVAALLLLRCSVYGGGVVSFLSARAVGSCGAAASAELWSPGAGDWLSAIKNAQYGY